MRSIVKVVAAAVRVACQDRLTCVPDTALAARAVGVDGTEGMKA